MCREDERTGEESASPYLREEAYERHAVTTGVVPPASGLSSPWLESAIDSGEAPAEAEDEAYEVELECEAGEGLEGEEEDLLGLPPIVSSCVVPPLVIRGPLPTPTPERNCVPFAMPPPAGSYWPVVSTHRQGSEVAYQAATGEFIGNRSRRFLAVRSGRYHAAIDLYANYGDAVVACEPGRIVAFYGFCCKPKNTSWALLVEHPGVVVNYGEVHPDSLRQTGLAIGAMVTAGQPIASIGRNPNGSSMLHFETFVPGTPRNVRWPAGRPAPAAILNPTAYLLQLRDHGLRATARAPLGPPAIWPLPTPAASPPSPPSQAPSTGSAPSGLDIGPAMRRNAELATSLGWGTRFDEIVRVLGFTDRTPSQDLFAQAVWRWQSENRLSPDGIIGPLTWAALRPLLPAASSPTTPGAMIGAGNATTPSIPPLGGNSVPPGFRAVRKGLSRGSNVRLETKLRSMSSANLIRLSDENLDTFQRIANVETSGTIQSLNTWDSGVVSIGFMQWTLKYGELQHWIAEAPSAFRRYGIELDRSTYGWGTHSQPAIVGAPDRETLRWDGWAERFFLAGLDDEAIAVEVRLAEAKLARSLSRLRAHVRKLGLSGGYEAFEQHYGRSLEIRGIFQEAYNNLPLAARNGTVRAIRRVLQEGTMQTDRFLETFRQEILGAYRDLGDNGTNVIEKTRTGATVSTAREELAEVV